MPESTATAALAKLLSETQTLDNGTITLNVVLHEVVQKLSSLADHLEQTSAGVVVLGVNLQMSGKSVDPVRENCNLDFGRTGVALVSRVFPDQVCLDFAFFEKYGICRVTDGVDLLLSNPKNDGIGRAWISHISRTALLYHDRSFL